MELLGQPPGSASFVVTHAWPAPPHAVGDSPLFVNARRAANSATAMTTSRMRPRRSKWTECACGRTKALSLDRANHGFELSEETGSRLAPERFGNGALELVARHVPEPLGDPPAMAERIGDLPVALTPEDVL